MKCAISSPPYSPYLKFKSVMSERPQLGGEEVYEAATSQAARFFIQFRECLVLAQILTGLMISKQSCSLKDEEAQVEMTIWHGSVVNGYCPQATEHTKTQIKWIHCSGRI